MNTFHKHLVTSQFKIYFKHTTVNMPVVKSVTETSEFLIVFVCLFFQTTSKIVFPHLS